MLGCSVACLAWSWVAGKDLNWDQLNYHLYTAYHFLDDRVERDFMAASIQGYLNPLAYLPFYLMVRANWHSLLIGSALALLHSTCLWLICGIARVLIPANARFRTPLIVASVIFAFLTPVFMVEVGSSFIDVTTAIPVLAGVLVLMRNQRDDRGGTLVVVAGLLMGSAAALKLTNAVFPVAAAAFIVMADRPARQRALDVAGYAAGGVAGFVLVAGAWSHRLYVTFGSPFFPWFNAWFRSPDFPAFNVVNYRFVPETLSDYLLFPFVMVDVGQKGYTETISPDGRVLALLAILVLIGAAVLIRRRRGRAPSGPVHVDEPRVGPTYPAALVFAFLSYVLWLATSGNGRYGMPLLLFVGPMIPASMLVLSGSRRVLAYSIGTLLLAQATLLQVVGPIRWTSAAWTSRWFVLDVPETLRARPFLYLSLNRQTAAFLAPFLNPDSSFVNLVGQVSLAFDRPGGQRLRAIIDRNRPNIRTLMLRSVAGGDVAPPPRTLAFQNNLLTRVGLEVDASDCLSIEMQGRAGFIPVNVNGPDGASAPAATEQTHFLTCATRPLRAASEDPRLTERRTKDDRAFALLEAACPRLFNPAGAYTDHYYDRLLRNYVNSDMELWELGGLVEYRGWHDVPQTLGRVDEIAEGKLHFDCRFARIAPSVTRN